VTTVTDASPTDLDGLATLLDAAAVGQRVPQLAIAVTQHGRPIFTHTASGVDGIEPPSAHTAFSLASVTKPLTATALMLLVDRGLVDLDAPANDYLPTPLIAKVGDATGATVRRVANHTAGLPTHFRLIYEDEAVAVPGADDVIARYGRLVSPPGESLRYSNLGYGVLARIVAHVSGQPFADFMDAEVFTPLGMHHSWIGRPRQHADAAARFADDGAAYPYYDVDNAGAAAGWSTAADLTRFAAAHLPGGALLTPESRTEMQRITAPIGANGCGIGWFIADEFGHRTVSHGGGMAGVTTFLHLVPAAGLVTVILTNSASLMPLLALGRVLSAVLPGYGRQLSALEDPVRFFLPDTPSYAFAEPDAQLRPTVGYAGHWAGTVETPDGSEVLELDVSTGGPVVVRLGNDVLPALGLLASTDDALVARLDGQLRTTDTASRHHQLVLEVNRRDDRLTGYLMAVPHNPAGESAEAGRRYGNGLSHWLELSR
jgi:CubicO group peptidase (beta-lactamase class C family)